MLMYMGVVMLVLVHLSAQVRRRCHAQPPVLRSQETVVQLPAQHVGLVRKWMFLCNNSAALIVGKWELPNRNLLVWNRLSAENGLGLVAVGATGAKGLAVDTGGGARGGGAKIAGAPLAG